MDARSLRGIDPKSYAGIMAKAKTLAAALDDGFQLVDRQELVGLPMLIVAWEITEGFGSNEYAEVWTLTKYKEGDVRRVKFQDGGRRSDGIPATLARLRENGISADVAAVLRAEEYEFRNKETGMMDYAVRYSLDTPEAPADADPDF